ncbi:hypothetical protein CASFOL_004940 [Castilleja foliolosa]|uniref:Uncharacterized protein n=1 Tax=Castilleja foliolosa TaxID=1961234 RepID=A0ABD3EBW7_9LAMI
MLVEEVEVCDQVNDNIMIDNPGEPGEVTEELVTDNSKTCTDQVTGNMVVQEDDETVKVTKNVVVDPPEKSSTDPESVMDSREGEQNTGISNTTGAKSLEGVPDKGKTVVVADKIVGDGKHDTDSDSYTNLRTRNSGYTLIKTFKDAFDIGLLAAGEFRSDGVRGEATEGRELRVEADDVTHVLGIPNGDTIIKIKSKNIPHPLVTDWRALFPVHLKNTTATHVADKMLSEGLKTIWFKRLFLILITTCLVESCDNGFVITRIIPNFEEPDRARELNWGQYTKKCLAEEVVAWNKNNKKEAFTGPLVFLLALYVDRVDIMDQLVKRVYPTVKGWTCTLLRQREKFEILAGGFGRGYPVDQARPEMNEDHIRSKNRGPPAVDANAPIIEMVQSAPVNINENVNLKKVVDNTEHLLGCKFERPEVAEVTTDAADPLSTWENEDFWSDPEIIALMDGIAKGVGKRDKLASGVGRREELRAMGFDCPPFSLGMTQDYPDVVVQRKNDEAGPITVVKDVDPKGKGKGKTKVSYEQETQDAEDFVEIPSKRVIRNAASMKRSISGCSPYTLRATKAGDRLNKVEKELSYWVMNNDELDSEFVVFDEENFELIRQDIMTLDSGLGVAQSVVDVWSVLMNKREHLRSPSSPGRFFATLDVH